MKYLPLQSEMFVRNRKRFAKELKGNSVAIFNSNDIMPTNADGSMSFIQNSDLFYLCGIDQEETILVLYPDASTNLWKEMLFLRETNPHIAVWEGHKYSKEEARKASGIEEIYWLSEFEMILRGVMGQCKHVYLNTNEHTRARVEVETRDARFGKWCKEKYPMHHYERSAPIMHLLRMVKSKEEVELIKYACSITEKGFRRLLPFIKPGVWEYEIEAELMHEFLRNRSRGFAYGPIIASGKDSCVLHYTENNKQCKKGDIILLDVAAEYANYGSDMTRVVPIDGKFTKRQKEVYNAVLRVFKGARKMLVKGNHIDKYNTAIGHLMEEEMVRLKLLKMSDIKKQDPKNPLFRKYFMHGTSHFLGLDIHDVGFFHLPFMAGTVFTCEPGIYIPQEKIGVRIENNILITEKGNIDLMEHIPIEADEIEELMNK
ncbi:MAG TPA: aminopeptidase P N-terminal domain-containing protein [Bacteroidia bacterium]|nr:aminopeptidase P N-terminal domain-containing protein [Bacteroidia bacterium]